MKILFITAYYSPEIAASLYLFENIIEGMIEQGDEVTIVTPTPTRGLSKNQIEIFKNNTYEEQFNGSLKIHRFPMKDEKRATISRVLRYFSYHIKTLKYCKRFDSFDLIMCASTPPTQGLIAKKLKRRFNCKFLYLLQDLFPESLLSSGIIRRKNIIYHIGNLISNKVYRSADMIIALSEEMKSKVTSRNYPSTKVHVINNWVEECEVKYVLRENNSLFDKYEIDSKDFIVSYAGNIGESQDWDLLISTARKMNVYKDVKFVIIGDGSRKVYLEEKVRTENICNIIVLPFQDYSLIAEVFSIGDVGIVISKSGTGMNSVPSKTWSIMSASRCLLASFDQKSTFAGLIKDAKCGLVVNPDSQLDFLNAIKKLYHDRELVSNFGENGRKYILKNLSKSMGVSRYIEVLNTLKRGME